jgi:hypothetical protein
MMTNKGWLLETIEATVKGKSGGKRLKKLVAVSLMSSAIGLSGCSVQDPITPSSQSQAEMEISLEDETAFVRGQTERLANNLSFSFDNFQCWDGGDCKVIYNIDYLGPDKLFSYDTYFSSDRISGKLSGSSGSPDTELDLVVLRAGSEPVFSGSFVSYRSYSVIINTKSKVGEKYEGVLLQSNGVTLLEDDFGCFEAKKESVATQPTC